SVHVFELPVLAASLTVGNLVAGRVALCRCGEGSGGDDSPSDAECFSCDVDVHCVVSLACLDLLHFDLEARCQLGLGEPGEFVLQDTYCFSDSHLLASFSNWSSIHA